MSLIIGISGKAGAGKDTVAKILQVIDYLDISEMWGFDESVLTSKNLELTIQQMTAYNNPRKLFEIIKFADPLKEMVAIMLGVDVKKLEDRQFKESELGEEWWKYEVCNYFNKDIFFTSDKEQDAISYITSMEQRITLKEELRPKSVLYIKQTKLTPRKILQLMGTEVGRNIHPNTWINIAMKKAESVNSRIVLIPDMRFKNELNAIKERKGITVRINRNVETGTHSSETQLDNEIFDYVIHNNGSLDDLIKECFKLFNYIQENCL